ncbi:MAG: outer rane immunogenic protein [Acidobacteriota bacterium]
MRSTGILALMGATLYASTVFAAGGVTPYIGYNYGGDSSNCASLRDCEERHSNFGVSFGSAGGTGFEQDIAYAKNFFGASPDTHNSVLTFMSNLVVALPLGPVHPFVVGGVGLIRPHATINPTALVTSKNAAGYDLGGGVSLSLGPRLALRGDIRRFNTFQDVKLGVFTGGKLSFSRATLGLTLKY